MNIDKLSIEKIHAGLMGREFSCQDLVDAYLQKINELNDEFNVFTYVCSECALNKAKKVDERILNGEEIGLLEGIPYSVKDAIVTKVGTSQAGSNILKNFSSVYDATVVERLDVAGAILLGKTNCDSFGHGSSTRNSDYGVTRNPFNKDYIAGGSSGGAAASVALNMCCFAIGEDTGGSIRQPASFCGVFGLKPSYGCVSRYGAIAYGSSLDTIGPITNNIDDIKVTIDVISGKDEKDVTTYAKNDELRIASYERGNKNKIGVVKEFMGEGLDERVKKLFNEQIDKYKDDGWEIVELSIPSVKYAVATYYLIACSETSSNLSRFDGVKYGLRKEGKSLEEMYVETRSSGFSFETKKRIILGTYALSAGYADKYYRKAATARALIKKEFDEALDQVDAILTPSSPVLPYKIDDQNMDPMTEYLADIYTVSPSLAGLCGLSIPIGMVDGFSVGMQLVGVKNGEGEMLAMVKKWFDSNKIEK